MTEIRVDVSEVRDYFATLGARIRKKEPLLKRIGTFAVEVSKQAFREGRDPNTGDRWEPLSPAYAKWKARNRYSKTPLTLKGALRRSIHYGVLGKKSVAWGTDRKYGRFHQYGTKRLPQRRFLGLSRDDVYQIDQIITRWVRGRKE